MNSHPLNPQSAAEKAVSVIGYGFDLTAAISLRYCKPGPDGSPLIQIDKSSTHDLVFPEGIVVPDVSEFITTGKGERIRYGSDVVSFQQMSELINQELSLSGKIPCGHFNCMFNFHGFWENDAKSTKNLAFDGWFISLYDVALTRTQIVLSEHIKQEVPARWNPVSIARFIEKYGTHIIVGVKMGGKDVFHVKQLQNSELQASEVHKVLNNIVDLAFMEDVNGGTSFNDGELSKYLKDEEFRTSGFIGSSRCSITHSKKEDIVIIHERRGGIDCVQSHYTWLPTIIQSPDVISMSFMPISSLLNGVSGSGFISHAINLYLRYKPPIEELRLFLEFQLPRQWAPMDGSFLSDTRCNRNNSPSLHLTFIGPKLYVNTFQVDARNLPVTGMRLYLGGKRKNYLAIHLQHLNTLPSFIEPSDYFDYDVNDNIPSEQGYYEPIRWSILSHVCTAPVEYNGSRTNFASIVRKAWFEVKDVGIRKVLFLRLGFSTLSSSAKIRRSQWDSPVTRESDSSSVFSISFSSGKPKDKTTPKAEINSAVYPGGPPVPFFKGSFSRYIDTTEMTRGPQDTPGYWVVTGAKLCIEENMLSLRVKYSLLLYNNNLR